MYPLALFFTFLLLSNVLVGSVDQLKRETIGYGMDREDYRFDIEQISWEPRAFHIRGFLTDEQCDHLIKTADPSMVRSTVVDSETGGSILDKVRTSTGTFLAKNHDKIVAAIEERVSRLTMLPVSHQEAIQILRYVDGQEYKPHFDYFHDSVNIKVLNGGQRVVTVLMYLTNVEEGGETIFPDAADKVTGSGWSECAQKGLAVHPAKGDALMFYSLTPKGEKDKTSLHGSCPIIKGVKWSATKWIHLLPIGGKAPDDFPTSCEDVYKECPAVAKRGQCKEDELTEKKYCRKSCQACQQ